MGLDDTCQGAFIGDGYGLVTQLRRARDQFLRSGGPPQEAEVTQAVKLGIHLADDLSIKGGDRGATIYCMYIQ